MRNGVLGGFLGFLLATGVLVACGSTGDGSTSATIAALDARIRTLEELNADFSRDESGDLVLTGESLVVNGGNLVVNGGNLLVRNGLGSTGTTNGAGNVIIGYNEFRVTGNDRSGSHMLVVGSGQNFTSYGGIVAGHVSDATAPYACVLGGYRNAAEGESSVVVGGTENTASALYAAGLGGEQNASEGECAAVVGGRLNHAQGRCSVAGGGEDNAAVGPTSSVAGGTKNRVEGQFAAIAGGRDNIAYALSSSILGGLANETWSIATYGCVSGGQGNLVKNTAGSISGGKDNEIAGPHGSIGGGRDNTVVYVPGESCATISGGESRLVENDCDWRAGTLWQDD